MQDRFTSHVSIHVFFPAIHTLAFQSFLLTLNIQLSACVMKNSYFIHSDFVLQELLFVLTSLMCANHWAVTMKRCFTFLTV